MFCTGTPSFGCSDKSWSDPTLARSPHLELGVRGSRAPLLAASPNFPPSIHPSIFGFTTPTQSIPPPDELQAWKLIHGRSQTWIWSAFNTKNNRDYSRHRSSMHAQILITSYATYPILSSHRYNIHVNRVLQLARLELGECQTSGPTLCFSQCDAVWF